MNNQEIIEKLKYYRNYFNDIGMHEDNLVITSIIQSLAQEPSAVSAEEVKKAIKEAEIMIKWNDEGGNPNRAEGQRIILKCLKAMQEYANASMREHMKKAFEAGESKEFFKNVNYNSGYDYEHPKYNKKADIGFDEFYTEYLNTLTTK